MEPAILGVLALMLTVMLYLDRSRRSDTTALRTDMSTQITALREEIRTGITELREETRTSSARIDARIDQLTTAVINLSESLGEVRGRTEVLVATGE